MFKTKLAIVCCIAIFICLSATLTRVTRAADQRSPNIVLILADDMGYGDATCFNPDSKAPTPHIDKLAAGGMRFTDAHAPASVCVPTRYGLMTGRYPFRAKLKWRDEAVIEAGRLTLPSLLKRNGYTTAMVGKWHLGFDGGPGGPKYDWSKPHAAKLTGGPVDRGFDRYFGLPASLDIPPFYYIRDRTPIAPPTNQVAASSSVNDKEGWTRIQGAFWRAGGVGAGFKHEQVLPRIGKEAVSFIGDFAKTKDKPFFLYVAFTAPHTPWLPIEKFRGKSGASMYGDFVMQVDDTVGQITTALEKHGLSENTLVFFTSDNGPVWYPTNVKTYGHAAVGPLRGMKGDAYEGGHRVPFIARWPGKIPAGARSDETICFTDLMATFASIVGDKLPKNAGEDSYNILPALLGKKLKKPIRQATVYKAQATAIRQGDWKLITHLGSGGFSQPRRLKARKGQPQGQLYNLREDIGETKNLWDKHPDIVKRMSKLLDQYKKSARSAPAP